MLAYLQGSIQSKEINGTFHRIILDVSGIGFEIQVAERTALSIGQPGDVTKVHVAFIVRENEWSIFGFGNRAEREMFNLVQSVSGIGPKLALSLVGTFAVAELVDAIAEEDCKFLSQAPGVGLKVAQRLVLELKAKIDDWKFKHNLPTEQAANVNGKAFEEANMILSNLGYTPSEINHAFKSVACEDKHDVELLVRHSLKVMGAVSS